MLIGLRILHLGKILHAPSKKVNCDTIHFFLRRVEDLSNVENSQTNQLDGAPNEIFDGRNVSLPNPTMFIFFSWFYSGKHCARKCGFGGKYEEEEK